MVSAKEDARRNELERIRLKNKRGLLLPQDVVKAASNPKSPLHGDFEWDDSVAAHEYRLERARALIRVYVYRSEPTERKEIYVSLLNDRKTGGYRAMSQVIANEGLRDNLAATSRAELEAWYGRWQRLTPKAPLVIAVGNILGHGLSDSQAGN